VRRRSQTKVEPANNKDIQQQPPVKGGNIFEPSTVKDAEMQKRQAIQPSDQILFADIKGTSKITSRQAENPSIDSHKCPAEHQLPACLSPTKVPYLPWLCAEIY